MDKTLNSSTEEKIYEAARRVFVAKGMEGARMQEIADEAGMNKALLHYYYRSKENLFKAVFKDIFTKFFRKIGTALFSDAPVKEKLMVFIDEYVDLIQANPYVPQFIINEINRDPQMLKSLMFESGIEPQKIIEIFVTNSKTDSFANIDTRHIVVSIIGMLLFPLVARPLLQMIYFNDNPEAYSQFLSERKAIVKNMVLKIIEA
ncbi:MAG: TetR/AcrR family transcriptional regulator [Mariniphaga sp.]